MIQGGDDKVPKNVTQSKKKRKKKGNEEDQLCGKPIQKKRGQEIKQLLKKN